MKMAEATIYGYKKKCYWVRKRNTCKESSRLYKLLMRAGHSAVHTSPAPQLYKVGTIVFL